MSPEELTAEEDVFVDNWSQRAFQFIKLTRRADLYIRDIPREVFMAAYEEVTTSDLVKGRGWLPNREDKEAYLDFVEDLIKRHPLTSPKNAVTRYLAGHGGALCISSLVVMERREKVREQYMIKFHKLNNEDMNKVYGDPFHPRNDADNPEDRDNKKTFVRTRPQPRNPAKPISSLDEWKQLEQLGETFFSKDEDYETGFKAFELTGILIRKDGKFYEIHYEDMTESIRVSEEEFSNMLNEGVWV